MSKFYIDRPGQEITHIAWNDKDGHEDSISVDSRGFVDLHIAFAEEVTLYKEDIPKLIKALDKAKELGWW